MVLFGSEMWIADNLSRKHSSTAPVQAGEVEQKDGNMSDGLMGSVMSLDDILNSEDYTRVVSRGPNPRITHIFGDRVFEFQAEQLMPVESKVDQCMSHVEESVMSFCCFCSEKLKEGKDIYIYQGDKSFCSMECWENFMVDEMEEGEPVVYHPASPRSSPSDGGRIFEPIR